MSVRRTSGIDLGVSLPRTQPRLVLYTYGPDLSGVAGDDRVL